MRALGFTNVIRTVDGEELGARRDLRIAIHVETSITDGPGGDSALVVSDGTARLVNQNDCRTDRPRRAPRATARSTSTGCSTAGRSGTRWSTTSRRSGCAELVEAKVDSQLRPGDALRRGGRRPRRRARAPGRRRSSIRSCSTSTSSPVTSSSIFPDQRSFLEPARRRTATTASSPIPGTTIEVTTADRPSPIRCRRRGRRHLRRDKADLPRASTRPTGCRGSASCTARWTAHRAPISWPRCKAWWEPLLAMAPTLRAPSVGRCLLRAGDLEVLIDFPAGEVRAYAGEHYGFRFEHPARAGRDGRRRAGGRLEQRAVPVVPLPGVAGRPFNE